MEVLMEAASMLPVLAHAPSCPSSLLMLRRKSISLHMLQFDIELDMPLNERDLGVLLSRQREHVLATTVMCIFQGTFELARAQDIYRFPRHPIVLNFQSWCQVLTEATTYKDEEFILETFKSGANGYCIKSSSSEELLMAIRAVLAGKQYVSPEISDMVLEGYLEGRKTIKKKSSWDTLTQREREVLKLVGEGHQNKEIADYLCISPKTVEKHRANIMDKLNLHSASALTAFAIEKGLVTK